jgi:hypothetical protein
MRKYVAAFLITISAADASAGPVTCRMAGAIKYCETTSGAIGSTLGTDSAGRAVSLKITARRDTDENRAYALAYIGTALMILDRTSTQAQRAKAVLQLIDGANSNMERGHARLGAFDLRLRYDGPAMVLDADRMK